MSGATSIEKYKKEKQSRTWLGIRARAKAIATPKTEKKGKIIIIEIRKKQNGGNSSIANKCKDY